MDYLKQKRILNVFLDSAVFVRFLRFYLYITQNALVQMDLADISISYKIRLIFNLLKNNINNRFSCKMIKSSRCLTFFLKWLGLLEFPVLELHGVAFTGCCLDVAMVNTVLCFLNLVKTFDHQSILSFGRATDEQTRLPRNSRLHNHKLLTPKITSNSLLSKNNTWYNVIVKVTQPFY